MQLLFQGVPKDCIFLCISMHVRGGFVTVVIYRSCMACTAFRWVMQSERKKKEERKKSNLKYLSSLWLYFVFVISAYSLFSLKLPDISPDDMVAWYLSSVHPGRQWQRLGGKSWLCLSKFEVLADSSTRRISMASVDNILSFRWMELQWVINKWENSAADPQKNKCYSEYSPCG